MTDDKKPIGRDAFEKLVKDLEKFVQDSVSEADQKAKDYKAPELYLSDMKGYARGLSVMGYRIIREIKKLS